MTRIEWDESLDTGDLLIDGQHRGLVELVNRVIEAERSGDADTIPTALETLTAYVVVHFAAEEELMVAADFPPAFAEQHKTEHRELTKRTRELVLAYRAGHLESVMPLADLLRAWLGDHIQKCDRRLVEHVSQGAC